MRSEGFDPVYRVVGSQVAPLALGLLQIDESEQRVSARPRLIDLVTPPRGPG